ncbi:ATP-binding protein [Neobacillus sp. DY30]|uniref:ATP-binding protein n=1 Tax=Neobacillus sp. DY30 TaxID=3047871 RepID=UPI0024C066C3|nr:ATP-binding protein [Neobacillus sp. DY30]WHY01358.1 ATP-binding protein [Neobacillus sp. DY30]
MQSANSFLSKGMDDIYRKFVMRSVPKLKGQKFETKFQAGMLMCPGCFQSGKNGTGAVYFRLNTDDDWIQVGEISKCTKCREVEVLKEYQNKSLEKQIREIGARLMSEYFILPNDLRNAGFKNYLETNNVNLRAKKEAVQYTKTFIDNIDERHNLLIMGNPGTGKSHLCAAIARTVKEKGIVVGFLTTGQLLSKIKATYQNGASKTEKKIFEDIKKLDLLILDDLGSEAKGGNDDWRKSMIFEVVNSRIGLPTIYTSNLTETDLPVAVGERVYSRLYNNTKFIDLFTDDYRKKLMIK